MSGVGDMLKQARATLGMGEPNKIQRWYDANIDNLGGNYAWCDAAVTYWAYHSGNAKAVCPKGGRAYTVYHANDFASIGRWYSGTAANVRKAKPGDIVFFDWSGSNSRGAIDHVGVVEKNLGGGRLQTIEGNTSNRCLRRVRTASTIAGYGRPAYSGSSGSGVVKDYWTVKIKSGRSLTIPKGDPILKRGSKGNRVKWIQRALPVVGAGKLDVDGDFGPKTEAALKRFQRANKLTADGEYGPKSAAKLYAVIKTK